jgi:hypothetical protein
MSRVSFAFVDTFTMGDHTRTIRWSLNYLHTLIINMIKISFWMHIFHNNKICVQQNTAYIKKCDPHQWSGKTDG